MRLIDWYFFRQLAAPFLFFTLVLTGVIWLAQSLTIIDLIVQNGQSAMILFEFAVPLLPRVFSIVLPVAALVATIYALNRLLNDSELVVIYAAGEGRLSAIRAVLAFGIAMTAGLAAITLYLDPVGQTVLRTRTAEVRSDIAAALIRDGRFMHPVNGLTVYIREARGASDMRGLLVHDARDADEAVTYHAEKGALVRTQIGPQLVMVEGIAQHRDRETGSLSLLRFDKLSYDLAGFMGDPEDRVRKPSEFFFYELISPPEGLTEKTYGRYIAEGHEQLSAPLYGFAIPLVAAAVMLGGAFSRRGYFWRVWIAGALGIGLRISGIALQNGVKGEPALWPLMYAPPILAALAALMLLARGRFGAARGTPIASPV